MIYIWGVFFFLFGAAVGSFILVIVERYGTGLPFFKGRSVCFACNNELKNKDLIPILSFILLKGRCRSCDSKIPVKALLVEITMGLLSLLTAFKAFSLELRAWSLEEISSYLILTAIFGVILLISVYDLKHFIIPDSFLLVLFFLALSSKLLAPSFSSSFYSYLQPLISGLVLALPFLLILLASRGRWLGFGDVKYIAVLGFWLGLITGLSAVILAFWVGAAFSLSIIFLKRFHFSLPLLPKNLTIKSEIPFGPFLSLGALIAFYFSLDILQLNSLLNVF